MTVIDWIIGDKLGLEIPAHRESLRAGGVTFLTQAFRAAGALAQDNRVIDITQFEECPGGSTGRKLLLSVEYEKSSPSLPTKLFVKFSRDFDDEVRDRAKNQLEPEVRLALLSRAPGFPIAVPTCLFADYHHESGTGIVITERIPFGTGALEPLYAKCLDYEMPESLEHYRALIKALARLAGTHKAGRLHADVAQEFPFDPEKAAAEISIHYSIEQLQSRVKRLADFATKYPNLLPVNITSSDFFKQLAEDLPRFVKHEAAIKQLLSSQEKFIALIHWNANIDNGWYWRNARGELECGLLDWGGVGQMNIGLALWSALSGAETSMWDNHLDELLTLFAEEFHRCGGPKLNVDELKLHTLLFVAMLGISWLLDGPRRVETQAVNLNEVENRFDVRIKHNEAARTVLQMMTNFLNLWQTQKFGKLLDHVFLQKHNR
jgi:hypothetical protein